MTALYLPQTFYTRDYHRQRGFVYGLRQGELILVAGIIHGEYEAVLERLKSAGEALGVKLEILGTVQGVEEHRTGKSIDGNLFRLEFHKGLPPSIASTGFPRAPRIIYYSPPKRLELLSLRPIPLSLPPGGHPSKSLGRSKASGNDARQSGRRPFDKDDEHLERVVEWVNLVPVITRQIERGSSYRMRQSMRFGPLALGARLVDAGFALNISILSFRLPMLGALRDHSTAARQIATRLELLRSAPGHYSKYLALRKTSAPSHARRLEAHANYIRFWNTVWLFANDLIVGYALSAFVRENSRYLSKVVETLVQTYISGYLRELLEWLNDWPGGVKLNNELSSLICDSFLFLSRLWEAFVLTPFLPRLPALLQLFAVLGFFGGASLLLALASDLLGLLTFPFFGCYVAATLVYRWSLVGLSALFNVFRGKKYNPLRARTEPATYSVDALLLGTILFVTLIFLFPTILAFYLAFASSRLTIVAVQTVFSIAIQALNAFPLFALMLRFKSPARLPFSVQFRHCTDRRHWEGPHLHLENQPLPLSLVLADLVSLAKAFFSPKTQLNLLSNLCIGKVIFDSPLQTPSAIP